MYPIIMNDFGYQTDYNVGNYIFSIKITSSLSRTPQYSTLITNMVKLLKNFFKETALLCQSVCSNDKAINECLLIKLTAP